MSEYYIINRPTFEQFFVKPILTLTQRGLEHVDPYPKGTLAASSEVRIRGGDIDTRGMATLIEMGVVSPRKRAKNLEWSREDIDAALAYLVNHDRLTHEASARAYYGIEAEQSVKALREAQQRTGITDEHQLVKVILPRRPLYGEYAEIRYYSLEEYQALTGQRKTKR
jgi:hypothetical protein